MFTYEVVTRFIDVILAMFAVILLLPVIIFIVIILRLTGEKEVFYFQERIGKDGQKFKILKFATMIKNSPNIGAGAITLRNDPRVLPFGKFLRKTKFNELPQLVNIIKGDMSIVGPRPLMQKQYNFYSDMQKNIICKMRPGLTGASSIIFRDEEQYFDTTNKPDVLYQNKIAPTKALIEIWYYEKRTIKLYLTIIFTTALAVAFPRKKYDFFLDKNIQMEINNVLSKLR